ncbi:MAG: hypothetical protein ACLPQ6_04735 [Steroidobacteraceae bacterium]
MRGSTLGLWMGAAFGTALVLAAVTLLASGAGEAGTVDGLRLTARLSYLLFWPAYAGGALAALFGSRFLGLARRGRELGLAYASAHLVHAGLVAWLYDIAVRPPPLSSLEFFGFALFCTYLLAFLSIKRLAALLHPTLLHAIRVLGMEYIAFAFLVDFSGNPFRGSVMHALAYFPFITLAVAGPSLRVAALLRRVVRSRRPAI